MNNNYCIKVVVKKISDNQVVNVTIEENEKDAMAIYEEYKKAGLYSFEFYKIWKPLK